MKANTWYIHSRMRVKLATEVSRGAALTKVLSNERLLAVRDVLSVETHLLGEKVQKVYRNQGVKSVTKHIEVMVRQVNP